MENIYFIHPCILNSINLSSQRLSIYGNCRRKRYARSALILLRYTPAAILHLTRICLFSSIIYYSLLILMSISRECSFGACQLGCLLELDSLNISIAGSEQALTSNVADLHGWYVCMYVSVCPYPPDYFERVPSEAGRGWNRGQTMQRGLKSTLSLHSGPTVCPLTYGLE